MPISKSLTTTAEALCAQAKEVRGQGKLRYPNRLRKEVAACVAAMRLRGMTWDQCKELLGICKATLHSWNQGCNDAESQGPALVQVRIRPENNSECNQLLQIVTPSGYVLKGVDLAQAVQLLRELR